MQRLQDSQKKGSSLCYLQKPKAQTKAGLNELWQE